MSNTETLVRQKIVELSEANPLRYASVERLASLILYASVYPELSDWLGIRFTHYPTMTIVLLNVETYAEHSFRQPQVIEALVEGCPFLVKEDVFDLQPGWKQYRIPIDRYFPPQMSHTVQYYNVYHPFIRVLGPVNEWGVTERVVRLLCDGCV